MKITLKIPIVKQSPNTSWDCYKVDGSLEIEAEDEEYSKLKERANTLLTEISADYQLIRDSQRIAEQIASAKGELSNTKSRLRVAQNQLERLTQFLNKLGIDARDSNLAFSEYLSLRSANSDDSDDSDDVFY